MTSNAERAATLEQALRAGLAGDTDALGALVTDDVRTWTPSLATESLPDLLAGLERDPAFSDYVLDVVALDVGGDFACVEWTVTMTHSGPIALVDGTTVEPTGIEVVVHGTTVAEFEGERICALRQYWDELAALEQIGVLLREP